MDNARRLRDRLARSDIVLAPGVHDALAARLAERAGFEAVYFTGAGFAYTHLGAPDLGLVSLTETVWRIGAITEAVSVPVIADGDTGYGNALNIGRTVREFERAGAAAIQIEDQTFPKRCGHLTGKTVISPEEMIGKIKAAADVRRTGMLIVGRTDARAVEGLSAALERAMRYKEAGADILFIEAPQSRDELATIPVRVAPPVMANMVEGGVTPMLAAAELQAMGFRLVIFPGAAVRVSAAAMQQLMITLRQEGTTASLRDEMMSFSELNDLLGLPEFQRREERYLRNI
jgi:2-methylisocitrate lyase-like PEP mutase family enzyme